MLETKFKTLAINRHSVDRWFVTYADIVMNERPVIRHRIAGGSTETPINPGNEEAVVQTIVENTTALTVPTYEYLIVEILNCKSPEVYLKIKNDIRNYEDYLIVQNVLRSKVI